ncbi:TonB-dependent receptor [Larkinella terrae]|uniref:TonB-dependent receptor n=1 Tax=Larkinella terrae TaxID=2025311 RepID=UPI00286E08B4|nr:TonB-dependent receptor [Larkinella terrae]
MNTNSRIHFVYLLTSILVCILCPTFAQEPCDCFIKGVVLDKDSRQPIPGAAVFIKELQKGTVSDADGHYRIDQLCQGQYTLISRILGYREIAQSVTLVHTSEQNVLLTEDDIHLKDVDVTAQRTAALSSQMVSQLEGKSLDQTRGQSLGDALRNITGVTTLQTGSSIAKPVIHGMHSNRVLILNNGIRQEGQQWGSEHAPEIDPFVANRISVIKGAAGVRFGSDAIGGVILVEPAPLPTTKTVHGELNLVGFTNGRQGVASLQTEGGFGKGFGWRVQGTIKRGGNIRTPGYFLDNTGISEQNFSGSLGYRATRFRSELYYSRFKSRIGIFSGSHIGSLTDLQAVLENGEPFIKSGFSYVIGRPYQQISHDLLKWKTDWKPASGGDLSLTLARQFDDRMEYDLHRPKNDSLAALNRPELRFRLTTYTGDLVFEHKPVASKLTGSLGISGFYQYNIMNGRPLIPNFRTYNAGIFWIEKLKQNRWEYEAGLRYDYRHMQVFRYENKVLQKPLYVFQNFSGTVGATYTVSEQWSMRFNAGTSWRAPNVSELFSDGVHHGAAAYELGDSNLRPEVAYNLNLSTNYSGKRVQAEIGFFYNTIQDYIYLKPQAEPILTIRGAFPSFKYTQTDALYAGLDVGIEASLFAKLSGTSKLSLLYVQDTKLNQPIVMTPPNRWENGLRYDFGKVGKWRDAYAGIGNLWVARQNRVPANSDFLPPPPAYSLWNLTAGFALPVSKNHQVDVGLTVNNLFNTVYRDYLNRFRYYADDPGRTISVRLKWKF